MFMDLVYQPESYLSNSKQKTKINTAYSSWKEIFFGVPQGSILGPLLSNIFICDLFSIMNKLDIASYADDSTPYVLGNGVIEVINSLKEEPDELLYWFANNQMKSNPDKCRLLSRVTTYMDLSKRRILLNACFILQFSYCSLV